MAADGIKTATFPSPSSTAGENRRVVLVPQGKDGAMYEQTLYEHLQLTHSVVAPNFVAAEAQLQSERGHHAVVVRTART